MYKRDSISEPYFNEVLTFMNKSLTLETVLGNHYTVITHTIHFQLFRVTFLT